jgi:hypothetical protein
MALFPNLQTEVFDFIETDFYEYIAIDKNKKKKGSKLEPLDNVILYYKNYCLTTIIYNKPIEFIKDKDIDHLKIVILNFEYAFNNNLQDSLLFINNLPFVNTLTLKFINEHHDNFNSCYYASYYTIDDNLPPTLKKLTITGISQQMIDDLKKIPFGCELKYEIMEED